MEFKNLRISLEALTIDVIPNRFIYIVYKLGHASSTVILEE